MQMAQWPWWWREACHPGERVIWHAAIGGALASLPVAHARVHGHGHGRHRTPKMDAVSISRG